MSTTVVRSPARRRNALVRGTRVLLGLVGAFKLAGTAYFLFVATAEQGGDPRGWVTGWSGSGRRPWR
jgi:hypothetical protein